MTVITQKQADGWMVVCHNQSKTIFSRCKDSDRKRAFKLAARGFWQPVNGEHA